MKKLDEYINESLLEEPGMMVALFLAACFCIPNGVGAVWQLIRNRGKRKAADELLSKLDRKQMAAIKKLSAMDLDTMPHTKKMMDLIMKGADREEVLTQYYAVRHSKEIERPEVLNGIESATFHYLKSRKVKYDNKLRWTLEPSTFLSMLNFTRW